MSNFKETRALMRSDIRQSEPPKSGIKKSRKFVEHKLTGLSRKQITVGKTAYRNGRRICEVKGVAKHANRLLGHLIFDESGGVWRYKKIGWDRLSVEAHRTKNGCATMFANQL